MNKTATEIIDANSLYMPGHGEEHAGCTVRIVSGKNDFDALEIAWNKLLENADSTIFQTYEWQRTWWNHFGKAGELSILVFERGGETIGIAPLFLRRVRIAGIPVARHLQFMGAGLSDYLSPIIAPGSETTVIRALVNHLSSSRGDWDVFDLEDVNDTESCRKNLPRILEALGFPVYLYQGSVCPHVALPSSAEELMHELGSAAGNGLRRKFKKLKSNHQSEIDLVKNESDDMERAVADFADIHGGRWKSQGHPSAFDDQSHRAFHVEICKKFAKRDWLRMYFLRVDGARISASFSFNYKTRIYMYQSNAHASDELMKLSPGFLIRWIAMVEGITEGMRVFDFMRGNEAYKYRDWTPVETTNWLIRSASPAPGARARFAFFLVSEFAGKVTDRLGREYYDYLRFRVTEKGIISPFQYAFGRLKLLFGMSAGYVKRHAGTDMGGNGSEKADDRAGAEGSGR